jgi:UDP-glucose 4-epimerase
LDFYFLTKKFLHMKYIITGGAGFIGSHLADALLKKGEQVISVDNLSTGSLKNLDFARNYPKKSFQFIQSDIREIGLLDTLIAPNDVIFHLAATVGVKKVCQNPNETWRNNFLPTELLVDIATQKKCRLVFTSTSEVYGDAGRNALAETDAACVYTHLSGRSAYILGKMMGEHVCLNAHQTHGTSVIVARLFNTTGHRQSADFGMVIPTFIQQSLRGETLSVFGDGTQTRSFSEVSDTVEALLRLLDCPKAVGEIVNIGNPEEISIYQLAGYINEICASNASIQLTPMPIEREGNKDIQFRRPCIKKLQDLTDWQPRYQLFEILQSLVQAQRTQLDFEINKTLEVV